MILDFLLTYTYHITESAKTHLAPRTYNVLQLIFVVDTRFVNDIWIIKLEDV